MSDQDHDTAGYGGTPDTPGYGDPGADRDAWGPPRGGWQAAGGAESPTQGAPSSAPGGGTPWWAHPLAADATGAGPGSTAGPVIPPYGAPDPSPSGAPSPYAPGGVGALPPLAPPPSPWAPPPAPLRRQPSAARTATVAALVAGLIGGGVGAGAVTLARERTVGGPSADGGPTLTQVRDTGAASRPAGSVADIAARVLRSVVTIKESSGSVQGTGSGVVIDKTNGYILTNNHVVADVAGSSGTISVIPDGGRAGTALPATIVGTDAASDLAVVKVSSSSLPAIELGKSSDVVIGDQVLAVGAPLGLSGTVTEGIVSALDRNPEVGNESGGSSIITGAIQTDAAINPGNSGGALVDNKGRLIGINTAIASNSGGSGQAGNIGIGFAIPIDVAAPVAQQLIAGEKVTHPYIGVTTSRSTAPAGALITSDRGGVAVRPGSPAATAGLREGDIITRLGGTAIGDEKDLIAAVRRQKVGDAVDLTVVRDGQQRSVKITLADNPAIK